MKHNSHIEFKGWKLMRILTDSHNQLDCTKDFTGYPVEKLWPKSERDAAMNWTQPALIHMIVVNLYPPHKGITGWKHIDDAGDQDIRLSIHGLILDPVILPEIQEVLDKAKSLFYDELATKEHYA